MTNRSKIVVFALCLSVALSVFGVLGLFDGLKDREFNTGHLMSHWTTYVLFLLFITSPVVLFMVYRRSFLFAYIFLFIALYYTSYFVFWSWLAPRPEFGPDTLTGGILNVLVIFCVSALAVYMVRTSREEQGERPRWVEWRFIFLLVLVVVPAVLVACQLTLGEPRIIQGFYYRAEMSSDARDYKKAISIYDTLLQKFPDQHSAYCRRGLAKIQAGDPDSAILDLNRGLEMLPAGSYLMLEARCRLNRGIVSHKKGHLNDALRDYGATIELVWDDNESRPGGKGGWKDTKAYAYYTRGLVRFQKKDFDGAQRDFLQTLKMAKDAETIKRAKKCLEHVEFRRPRLKT